MNYINNKDPKFSKQNVIPILISAEFLIIKRLIDESIRFIGNNLSEVSKVPIDLNCLSSNIVKKLADSISLEKIVSCKDLRETLTNKLYSHKLDDLLKKDQNKLSR